jgi:hypothetical protein
MSTKTLRKRIALVAVSALTAGVLSVASAPVANANAADLQAIDSVAQLGLNAAASAGTAAAIGQCSISATALETDITTVNSTGTILAVGAVIDFDTTTKGTGQLRVSGPAKLSLNTGTTGTISQDAKAVGFGDVTSTKVASLEVTGVGEITVTAYNSSTIGSGTAFKTWSITGVDTCAPGATPVAANSFFNGHDAVDEEELTTSLENETFGPEDTDYGSVQYIGVVLRNQYKTDLTADGVLTAEGTGNVLVGIDGTGTTSIGFLATNAADGDNNDIYVQQNTTVAPGAPLTTTITIKFNGVTVATKTLSFAGLPTQIVVDEVTVGTSNSTGSFKYVVKDAAGNLLDTNVSPIPSSAAITATVAGFVSAGIVTGAQGVGQSVASTGTKATGTFNCVAAGAGTSGSQDIQIAAQVGTLVVKSNTFKATCGDSNVYSFTSSMDKAVYSPGEIATLTISAKDLNGGIVGDTAVIGAAFNQISIPGMTIIGSAISSADVFTSGSKTYKFRVDQAEGSFVGQTQVTVASGAATAEKTVKTLQYSIKSSAGTVTNAEVLKSIVSLIASINKQIQALQKLILRR